MTTRGLAGGEIVGRAVGSLDARRPDRALRVRGECSPGRLRAEEPLATLDAGRVLVQLLGLGAESQRAWRSTTSRSEYISPARATDRPTEDTTPNDRWIPEIEVVIGVEPSPRRTRFSAQRPTLDAHERGGVAAARAPQLDAVGRLGREKRAACRSRSTFSGGTGSARPSGASLSTSSPCCTSEKTRAPNALNADHHEPVAAPLGEQLEPEIDAAARDPHALAQREVAAGDLGRGERAGPRTRRSRGRSATESAAQPSASAASAASAARGLTRATLAPRQQQQRDGREEEREQDARAPWSRPSRAAPRARRSRACRTRTPS